MRASRRLMPTAEGLPEEFEYWLQGHVYWKKRLGGRRKARLAWRSCANAERGHASHWKRNHNREDMRRRVHIAQAVMRQRHFALQAMPRSERRQHASVAIDLPFNDDMAPDIAG